MLDYIEWIAVHRSWNFSMASLLAYGCWCVTERNKMPGRMGYHRLSSFELWEVCVVRGKCAGNL